jgi:methionyl-tRNA formyltransferase
MVVVGYGQIIPKSILDIPPRGILNVHASLLPQYRGAAPIQWAIANGERATGVTIMRIDEGLDTGDILLKSETAIGERETAPQLGERLAREGARLLCEALARLDTLVPEPQDHRAATLAPLLKKEDGAVDWSWRAEKIVNRLRAFEPWPGCYSSFRGQRLHIRDAEAVSGSAASPGTLLSDGRNVYVACGEGTMLRLKEVQLEGKKRMTAEAFRNGYPFRDNERLGEPAP